jgi:N-methylhydantoinase A/oxoprolinase/acetone carboxylase beta subunit
VRIGIDVGGTSTDAVAMDGDVVVAWTKRPTTHDVGSGLEAALEALLAHDDVVAGDIDAVMIGTTHFINALLQVRDLDRVGILRLALPATSTVPPLLDWPAPLRDGIEPWVILLHGGHEFDGREISPLDDEEIAAAFTDVVARGCTSVAIAAEFAPASPAHELAVGDVAAKLAPDLAVTLSHRVGRLGLIERENACVLNASLASLARRVVGSYAASLTRFGIDADLYVSQNDGTVASVDDAVLTHSSPLHPARRTACAARPSWPASPTRWCSTSGGPRRTAVRSSVGSRGRRRASYRWRVSAPRSGCRT